MSRTRLTVSDRFAPTYIVFGRSSLFLLWTLTGTGLVCIILVVFTESVGVEIGLRFAPPLVPPVLPSPLVEFSASSAISRSEEAFFISVGVASTEEPLFSIPCSG